MAKVAPLPSRLASLTWLRAVAALMVFGYHVTLHTDWLRGTGFMLTWYTGVDFFFVLSGFVLFWSYRVGQKYRHFVLRRLARIYPLHFVFLCLAVFSPAVLYPKTWGALFAEIFLVHAWWLDPTIKYAFNGVSWTLSHELFFYLMAPFIIGWVLKGRRRTGPLILLATVAVIVVGSFTALRMGVTPLISTLPIFRIFEFIAGILTAYSVAHLVQRSAHDLIFSKAVFNPWISALCLLAFLGLLSFGKSSAVTVAIVVTPVMCWLLASFALHDVRRPNIGAKWANGLTIAGEASFAFYLCHEMVIFNVMHFLGSSSLPRLLLALMALLISAVIAYCAHRFIEKPAQRLLVNRFVKASREPKRR